MQKQIEIILSQTGKAYIFEDGVEKLKFSSLRKLKKFSQLLSGFITLNEFDSKRLKKTELIFTPQPKTPTPTQLPLWKSEVVQ